jgi:hypothetical protein
VALAFRRALEAVAQAEPDLVLVAGDLFHAVRPSNAAILDAFHQFRRFRARLPDVPIVIVAGNHDTPRAVETGNILRLFEAAVDGVHVAAHEPRRLAFGSLDLTVYAVPHMAWSGLPRPAVAPDQETRWNVLLTHREVEGILPAAWTAGEYGSAPIKRSDLRAEGFDYVALGHYHVATQVDRNVWYAGSLDYVTTNPWGESREPGFAPPGEKGWLLVTLAPAWAVEFRPVEPARRVLDLEPIHGAGLTAAELDRAIGERAHEPPEGIEGRIVRQVVYDVARITARDLDHAAIRDLKARALHYRLDLRRPQPAHEIGLTAAGRRLTLPELVAEHLRTRILPPGVSRERVQELARGYLEAAERAEG